MVVSKAVGDGAYWRVTELVFGSMDDLVAVGATDESRLLAEDVERLQKEHGNRNDIVFVEVEERPASTG